MAGCTTRIALISVPFLVAVLTAVWYLRKKKNTSLENSTEEVAFKIQQQPNNTENIVTKDSVSTDIICMNFERKQESQLAEEQLHTVICSSKLTADKMQLKDKKEDANINDTVESGSTRVDMSGSIKNKVCNGSHERENGATCIAVIKKQEITNGTSHLKRDKASDKEAYSVCDENIDSSFGEVKCDTTSELSNGMKSLSLDTDIKLKQEVNSSKSSDSCDVVCQNMSGKTPTDQLLMSSIPKLSEKMPSSIDVTKDDSELLSCQTNFERKALTPDSGVSAELHECDSSSSTVSEPSSECHLNGISNEIHKSSVMSVSSNDSGKDCAENHFDGDGVEVSSDANGAVCCIPSPHTFQIYEFEIPHELCGFLIGKNGRHVKYIHQESNADIIIKTHPLFTRMKVCIVSGTEDEIKCALELIRERFPLEQYPDLTLDAINPLQAECMLPITVRLSLPEGVNFDAILSSTVNPGHFFLQQPTHPTYHTLGWLAQSMTSWYTQFETPKLFRVSSGNVVAVPMCGGWYRAQVVEVLSETDECSIKFLDFGGYCTLPTSQLRQMRIEFTYVPFQAVECFLGSVTYPEGQGRWSDEAKRIFEELAQGQILQGYIVGYDGEVPYVHLYKVQGASTVFINRELVNQGMARWTDQQQQQQQSV